MVTTCRNNLGANNTHDKGECQNPAVKIAHLNEQLAQA